MNKQYTLIKEEYVDDIKSTVTYLKHNKSGARILLIKNDDPNKVFTVGFRTTPTDDTGVPHILEHSTLCGSKKFPVKDPFVELIKSSLNNFINAITFPDKTIYPVASLNLKDYKNLMEVYLDAVFFPNVYIHEEIFKQEGWHYELNDLNDDIIFNGVVYNEMKGAFSDPEEVLARQLRHELFPDNTYGVESGGDPMAIPDLTYEEFKNFHKRFYSPSNSYIVLYGDLDMDERLEYMDKEYLSKFDIVDYDTSINLQKPFKETKFKTYDYAIGKDENPDNKTYYGYSVATNNFNDFEESLALDFVTDLLFNEPGAPVKQALLDSGIAESIEGEYDSYMLQATNTVVAKGAKAGKEKEFKKLIEDEIRKQIDKGLNKKVLESLINSSEFSTREGDFGRRPKGLFYTIRAFSTWLYDDDMPIEALKVTALYKDLKEKLSTTYFEDLVRERILNNNHKVVVTLNPSKTYADEQEQKTKERLANYKASLSKEELLDLIEDTKHLKEYQNEPSTKEELATIPKLTLADIDKTGEKNINKVENIEGVEVVKHDIETNGIEYLMLSFDITDMPKELIPYIGLLNNVFSLVSTNKYSYQDLTMKIKNETGGIRQYISPIMKDDGYKIYLEIECRSLKEKLGDLFDTVSEIITTSIFTDKARMKDLIAEATTNLQNAQLYRGDSTAALRAMSYFEERSGYLDKAIGVDYYWFLKELNKNFDIDEISNKLSLVSKMIYRKENLIVSYTSLDDDYKIYLPKFLDKLFKDEVHHDKFKFEINYKNEAFKTPAQVNYVAVAGKYGGIKDYHGSAIVLSILLRYDYLWKQIRVLGGAYGQSIAIRRNGYIYATTYRDSNISRSINVIKNIPDYIDSLDLTKEELTTNIISAIGTIDVPTNPRKSGEASYYNYLSGITDEDNQKIRDEVINTTLEDLKANKKLFVKAFADPALCVVGNEKKIEEDGKDFKEKKNLL